MHYAQVEKGGNFKLNKRDENENIQYYAGSENQIRMSRQIKQCAFETDLGFVYYADQFAGSTTSDSLVTTKWAGACFFILWESATANLCRYPFDIQKCEMTLSIKKGFAPFTRLLADQLRFIFKALKDSSQRVKRFPGMMDLQR